MAGFENGRLQTAAPRRRPDAGRVRSRHGVRAGAQGVRHSRVRLPALEGEARAAWPRSSRPAASSPTTSPARWRRGEGTLEASMVKAYVCRAAEWVTREAMQLHGGMGYAEEFPVSRYFVDARVLSIFEGADETLCLRVIARRLAEQALLGEHVRLTRLYRANRANSASSESPTAARIGASVHHRRQCWRPCARWSART